MKRLFLAALQTNNQSALKEISKLIAHVVRDNMEDFHLQHLSDNQMKELNPLIRNGIYDALTALANCDTNSFCKDFISWHARGIPDHWEDPELIPRLQKAMARQTEDSIPRFKSDFLNEQYRLGNLICNSDKRCIEIRPSFLFNNSVGDNRKLRNKISAHLRKEGFSFDELLQGYRMKV